MKEIEKTVSIVIPIYKSIPDESEKLSLEQCCRILGNYKVSLVSSSELDCKYYAYVLEKYNVGYEWVIFDKKYFQSVESYNELLLSLSFYKTFSSYEYILIYQLDAFVRRKGFIKRKAQ